METQTETISWQPMELPNLPDNNTDVLIFSDNGDLIIGYWDDDYEQWFTTEGDTIENAVAWAEVKGPDV